MPDPAVSNPSPIERLQEFTRYLTALQNGGAGNPSNGIERVKVDASWRYLVLKAAKEANEVASIVAQNHEDLCAELDRVNADRRHTEAALRQAQEELHLVKLARDSYRDRLESIVLTAAAVKPPTMAIIPVSADGDRAP